MFVFFIHVMLDKTYIYLFLDLYTHIEFIHGEVHFNSCSEPIPFWPLQSTEELINLKEVKDHVYTYFSGLTTGQFLCIVKTAQNFEAYGLCVNGKSTWYNILTEWMSHFNKTDVDCKALRALYNRRLARFKEIQKRCNVRGNLQMKSTMIEFLNSAVCLPKRKMSTSAANVVTEAHQIPSTVVSKLDSQQFITLNSLIKVKQTTSKSLKKQNSIIKKQTEKIKEVSKENDDLKITLMSTDREHKILKDISGNEIALKNENDKLKKRNTDLFKKAKKAGDLERKSKFQERKIINMTKELKHLTDVASSAVCQVNETDRPDSEKQSLQNKLCTLRNELKSAKKKVQRRENNISKLHDKISCVRDKLDTDKKAIELYYTGIVDSLKNQHELSIEKVEAELASLKELETKTNGKYQAEIRLMYYDLLTKGVSANTVQNVVKTVLEHTTNYDVSTLKLPSRTSAQRMVSEADHLLLFALHMKWQRAIHHLHTSRMELPNT